MMEWIEKMNRLLILLFILSGQVMALVPGDTAPDFTLINQSGKSIKLSNIKNKFIVLEWFNQGCPFVRKHYDSENMQTIQKTYKENDYITWISISSSAKDKQGHIANSAQALKVLKDEGSFADHLLLDEAGSVGRAYGAVTTPQIVIIDSKMKVRYIGAIDSIASANPADIKKAKNYALSAISKLLLQQAPNPAKTKPYGCSVKY
jgi:peroxiredoxin